MTIKYVHTEQVKRIGPPSFVSREWLDKLTGFRSVFGFAPEQVELIENAGHTRDLHTQPVYCDEILIDFDDNVEAANLFEVRLFTLGHSFEKYDSGNRSVHFHVKAAPVSGVWVPAATKSWVVATAPGADMTVYRHASLFRLPGTPHEKANGRPKEMLSSHTGGSEVTLWPTAEQVATRRPQPARRGVTEDSLMLLMRKEQPAGGRRCYAWYLGACCYDHGLPLEAALKLVYEWNAEYAAPQLDQQTVETKVLEAYRSRELG